MRRREFLTTAVAGGVVASIGAPGHLRRAWAQGPIKIGMPAVASLIFLWMWRKCPRRKCMSGAWFSRLRVKLPWL